MLRYGRAEIEIDVKGRGRRQSYEASFRGNGPDGLQCVVRHAVTGIGALDGPTH